MPLFPRAAQFYVSRHIFHLALSTMLHCHYESGQLGQLGILHNVKYALGQNPLPFSGQRKVRLGEVRKNANFVLTMPFVRYENAIYADNANCANQNANYDDNAICACFTMLVCLGCTFGIVAHLAL